MSRGARVDCWAVKPVIFMGMHACMHAGTMTARTLYAQHGYNLLEFIDLRA